MRDKVSSHPHCHDEQGNEEQRRDLRKQTRHLGSKQDHPADRLHNQKETSHFDRVVLKELQERTTNNCTNQQRYEHHHGRNAVEDTILLHVCDAGGQIRAESPFYVIRRRGKNKGPDKTGKDAFQIVDHHRLVLFEQKKEVLKLYRLCLFFLHTVLFLDKEPANKGEHHRCTNNTGDQNGK